MIAFIQGDSYFQLNEWDKAKRCFSQVINNYPSISYSSKAMYLLAYIELSSGDREKAKSLLRKIINEHPKSEEVERARLLMLKL